MIEAELIAEQPMTPEDWQGVTESVREAVGRVEQVQQPAIDVLRETWELQQAKLFCVACEHYHEGHCHVEYDNRLGGPPRCNCKEPRVLSEHDTDVVIIMRHLPRWEHARLQRIVGHPLPEKWRFV